MLSVLHCVIAGTLGVCLWSLIGAFPLRRAASAVKGRGEPELYATAFATSLSVNLVTYVLAWGVVGLVSASTRSDTAAFAVAVGMVPVAFLLHAGVLADRLDMSLTGACRISVVTFLATVALGLSVLSLLGV